MMYCVKIIIIAVICVCKIPVFAVNNDNRLVVAVSSQFPPYTFSLTEKSGIDPELINRVLEHAGYEVTFIPTNTNRIDSTIALEEVDAVTGWVKEFISTCYVTKPYRYWLNVLIVSKASSINSLDDLKGKRLAKFQGAEDHIDGFDKIAKEASIMMISESSLQAGRMIRANRIDAYIGDYIGYYYALVSSYGEEAAGELTNIKHYFNRNNQRICFKDKAIRDAFDTTLDTLIDKGIYESVFSKYTPNVHSHHFPDKNR